eukprot:CAMPEP_0170540542 /NCGR_PEP_ID=MMETSP0211-20121228/527_1 /TAXON_ID=311385 /ORGANISM="Pseudokeronopsis sp., Strain OXSARD2" /LENGTH=105 /DNA_ID=CAMNT_0010842993 /DNA_START=941 /DNA_END=1259 /DNA_ORIENTATION=-
MGFIGFMPGSWFIEFNPMEEVTECTPGVGLKPGIGCGMNGLEGWQKGSSSTVLFAAVAIVARATATGATAASTAIAITVAIARSIASTTCRSSSPHRSKSPCSDL